MDYMVQSDHFTPINDGANLVISDIEASILLYTMVYTTRYGPILQKHFHSLFLRQFSTKALFSFSLSTYNNSYLFFEYAIFGVLAE